MSSGAGSFRSLAKSTVIIFAGTVLGNAVALLGQILIARSLPPETFGHVVLAYTVVSTIGVLAIAGVSEGVTQIFTVEETTDEQYEVVRSGYLLIFVTAGLAVITVYGLRRPLAVLMDDPSLVQYLKYFLPYLLLLPVARVTLGVLRAYGKSSAATLARDIAPRLIALVVLGALLFVGDAVTGAVLYWLTVPAVFCGVSLLLLNRELPARKVLEKMPSRTTTKQLWSFSWPLAISSALFIVLGNFDVLMIGYFLNAESVGHYRAIQPLRRIPMFILNSASFLLLPLVSNFYKKKEYEEIDSLYKTSTKWIIIVTFPVVLSVVVFAPDTVRVLFGEQYVPGAPALAILLVGQFVRAMFGLSGEVLKAIGATKIELYAALAGVVVNVVFNVLLIPRYQIVGAAVATALGYFVYNVAEVTAIYRLLGAHPISLNAYKPLLPTTVLGVLLSMYLIGNRLALPELVGIGLLLGVVHLTTTIASRSLNQDDAELLMNLGDRINVDLSWLESYVGGSTK
ncbi:flippase [Halorussus ruber]|uniref:flippase n=1 Tax=Halorussus ruber TaxID=1126238 RepID=UPI00109330D4|nr:flippase [Halorussus ruber]